VRRLRLVALGALLVVSAALGVAPAASAATTFGLTWASYGAEFGDTESYLSPTEAFHPGQTVRLQLWQGGAWVDKRVLGASTLAGQWGVEVDLARIVPGPGRYTLRALTRADASSPVTEARLSVTLKRAPEYFLDAGAPEDSTTTARHRVVTVRLEESVGQSVRLQRKSGAHWRTVSRARAATSGAGSFQLPVPAKAGLSTYRVVASPTTWVEGATSEPFTIHQTDTVRFASYIKQARRYMARYCPRTPIYIDPPDVRGRSAGDTVGMAWSSVQDAAGTSTLTTWIELRSGLTGKELRHVALHECAHIVQDRAYVTGRYEADEKVAYTLYPRVGIEGQADCMAYYFVRWKPALYYVRGCSSADLRNAAGMWRAYGKKYQSPVYTWRNPGGAVHLRAARGSGTGAPA
jgi:hypothetical protein